MATLAVSFCSTGIISGAWSCQHAYSTPPADRHQCCTRQLHRCTWLADASLHVQADYAVAQRAAQDFKHLFEPRSEPFSILFLTMKRDYLTAMIRWAAGLPLLLRWPQYCAVLCAAFLNSC